MKLKEGHELNRTKAVDLRRIENLNQVNVLNKEKCRQGAMCHYKRTKHEQNIAKPFANSNNLKKNENKFRLEKCSCCINSISQIALSFIKEESSRRGESKGR